MKNAILKVEEGSFLLEYKVGSHAPASFGGQHHQVFEDGYAINVVDGKISSIFICYRDGYEGFKACESEVWIKEQAFKFNQNTTLTNLKAAFGDPVTTWNDGVEMCAEFKIKNIQVEAIWNVDGDPTFDYLSIEVFD
ncbi:hypothetical protein [Microbulbifer variabilis]|uniref:hypothetical protein n=1 Tax=Microbulbifer variabilis TaxID=266805 RepID=UPI001CFE2E47|nr:hypothetical protein [Microbulbifer variabilis]